MIGCDCDVCRSSDPRDKRLRPSIYVEADDGGRLLVDTTPDLRTQALTHDIRRVDAICLTHAHADHLMGLDEVRRFNVLSGKPVSLFADESTLADVRRVFSYAFEADRPMAGGIPQIHLWTLAGPCCIGRQSLVPIPLKHGPWDILGLRFGRFAYLTDCNRIPDTSMPLLEGLDTLVLDALRHRPHPTHFSLSEAIQTARRIGARQTYFTHIAHDLGHERTTAALPPGMALAHDGLILEV
jgi:phosphoribosyl 1,2-cyclic phosphate phosphodiesterase